MIALVIKQPVNGKRQRSFSLHPGVVRLDGKLLVLQKCQREVFAALLRARPQVGETAF